MELERRASKFSGWDLTAEESRVFFGIDKDVLKLEVLVQPCECTKSHRIAHFKWVNRTYVDYISIKLLPSNNNRQNKHYL